MAESRITKLLTHNAFRWLFFCGGLLLLIWPMLGTDLQSRIDLLYIYLNGIWAVFILLLLAVGRAEGKVVQKPSAENERK